MAFPPLAESLLDVPLPHYSQEHILYTVYLSITAIVVFLLLPIWIAGPTKQLSSIAQTMLNLFGFVALLAVLLTTSHNSLTPRVVLQAPLLSPSECQYLLDMSHRVAATNLAQYELSSTTTTESSSSSSPLTREPKGWRKDRHQAYPTTDLNVVTDPFTKQDREWIETILNQRLAPILERAYGVSPASIRAQDMFIVRYDGDSGQNRLNKHTDSGHISFNVLLNDAFQGGGTRFHHRMDPSQTIDIHPPPGHVLLNNAVIQHEGLPTTSGTRYILVGFTNIDTVDPFTTESTGLSLFASWLSLPWIQRRFDEAHQAVAQSPVRKWYYNKYTKALFLDLYVYLTIFGDMWCPHGLIEMVKPQDSMAFLEALQDGYEAPSPRPANWFAGQQVVLDVDGTVSREWTTRQANPGSFGEL